MPEDEPIGDSNLGKIDPITGKPILTPRQQAEDYIKKMLDKINKSGTVAALLNMAFWGLGYVYTRERWKFGAMLMLSEILALIWMMLNPGLELWRTMTDPLVILIITLFTLAFGLDAYEDTVRIEKIA